MCLIHIKLIIEAWYALKSYLSFEAIERAVRRVTSWASVFRDLAATSGFTVHFNQIYNIAQGAISSLTYRMRPTCLPFRWRWTRRGKGAIGGL